MREAQSFLSTTRLSSNPMIAGLSRFILAGTQGMEMIVRSENNAMGSSRLVFPYDLRPRRAVAYEAGGTGSARSIGQTGTGTMTLRARLGMLRGMYGPQKPYRGPHTAGPALGALHQLSALGACLWAIAFPPPTMLNSPRRTSGSEEGQPTSQTPVISQVLLPSGSWKATLAVKIGGVTRSQNGWPSRKRSAAFHLKRLGCIGSEYLARRNCSTLGKAWCEQGSSPICSKEGRRRTAKAPSLPDRWSARGCWAHPGCLTSVSSWKTM